MENISGRIIEFNKDRIPKMVQKNYEFMKETLFRFYRGTDPIFLKICQKKKISLFHLQRGFAGISALKILEHLKVILARYILI